ncbi:MAG: type II toxin-antitoxin system prevent-host-death family antitoxin [Beijerinckiaceae bacterium]|nr:type II toxin-antitoxin system prevent-host-death family antitoxin [Beijerinckiaceae bacterium]
MDVVNIHQAKTHLSRLVERAAKGEGFIIAKSGKAMVKVLPIDAPEQRPKRRIGFMRGRISVPDDFDTMDAHEIARMFEGEA